MRRVAVFSDIHGNYQSLKSILDDISKEKFDNVICLGDILGMGPSSVMCLDEVMKSNIKMVIGNHELYQIKGTDIDNLTDAVKEHEAWINNMLEDRHRDYLNSLSLSYDILEDGHLFTFTHFLTFEDSSLEYPFLSLSIIKDGSVSDILKNSSYDYLFFGHEHNNFQLHVKERAFFCVGSSGCVKGNTTFYTIIEIDGDFINIKRKNILYDRRAFEKSIKANDYPSRKDLASIFFGIDID